MKSQFATSPNSNYYSGQEGGRRKPPYAFTEQGIYMLATVLKGEVAEQQSIFIMRAFRELRQFISNNAWNDKSERTVDSPILCLQQNREGAFVWLFGRWKYRYGLCNSASGQGTTSDSQVRNTEYNI